MKITVSALIAYEMLHAKRTGSIAAQSKNSGNAQIGNHVYHTQDYEQNFVRVKKFTGMH